MTDTLTRTIALVRAHLAQHRPAHLIPDIGEESSFEHDLRCDAIDMVCISLEAEDAFSLRMPPERFEDCETVEDLVGLVQSLSMENAS